MTRRLVLPLALAATGALRAQDVAIENVRLFDGHRVLESVTVVVTAGEITAIINGPLRNRRLAVVNGAGRTLLPGLIDAHVHARGSEENLRLALQLGVTTLLDLFSPAEAARRLRRAARANPGLADFRSAGVCATAAGGHGTQFGFPIPTIQGPEEAQRFVGERLAEGSDFIKIIIEPGSPARPRPTLAPETARALVTASHEAGKLVIAHISSMAAAFVAIQSGADGLAHIWRLGEPDDDRIFSLAAERGIFMIPTLALRESGAGLNGPRELARDSSFLPYLPQQGIDNLLDVARSASQPERFAALLRQVSRLAQTGTVILAGSDAPNRGTYYGVSLHRELELLVQAGMSPIQALEAATSAPAAVFGLSDRGVIAIGKRADLMLVEGDPTKDISVTRKIVSVWRGGYEVSRR